VPNRLQLVVDFVRAGGGLVKIGGYMSFTGIDARARYGMSPLASILPVRLLDHDDRVELPEGRQPEVLVPGHPAIGSVPSEWPPLLGYNRTIAKPGSTVVARVGDDPLIAVSEDGRGRVLAFTSDVAPHWAPPEFMNWPHYAVLWTSMIGWAARQRHL
ncbi:MAG TPA: glutamine amidotransferase, partial [Stellaceae bacterium]|nr:glutamine amidotransferase [Stellaceae bacterium]